MNLGVIPGRLNSNRFPRKIIYPLNGKAIIEHVYDNAKESKYLDKLIIAIDSEETKSHISNSCDTMFTSSEHKSGTDRVAEVSEKINSDIVVNIQGDEPVIDPDSIEQIVQLYKSSGGKYEVYNLYKIIADQNEVNSNTIVKTAVNESDEVMCMSRTSCALLN